MYHSFFSHSSADGHLGCFHVLAIINSAAMNIGGTRVSFPSGFLSVYARHSYACEASGKYLTCCKSLLLLFIEKFDKALKLVLI